MTKPPQPSSAQPPPAASPQATPPSRKRRLRAPLAAGILALLFLSLVLFAPQSRGLRAAESIPEDCSDLVINGSFEQPGVGWSIIAGTPQAMYSNLRSWPDGGSTSMLVGNYSAPNFEGASTVEQTVLLPADSTYLLLDFRYLGVFDGTPGAGDLQFVDLIDAATDTRLERLLETTNGANTWQHVQTELTAWGGRPVKLVFGVGNNGEDGRIAMFVDAVRVIHCPGNPDAAPSATPVPPTAAPANVTPGVTFFPVGPADAGTIAPLAPTLWPTVTPTWPPIWPTPVPTFWPTVTPTPTFIWATATPTWVPVWPTPSPTFWPPFVTPTPIPPVGQCTDILANGSFEQNGAWEFGRSPIPAIYTNSFNGSLGARAVQLGNPPGYSADVPSFSSVRQLASIPTGAGSVQLRWWAIFGSQEGSVDVIAGETDRQELILLHADLSTREVLWRARRVDGAVQQMATDMTRFAGETLYVYFNVRNDGNGAVTWMLLDGVQLCVSNVPAQPYNAQAAAQPGVQAAAPASSNQPALVNALGSLIVPRDNSNAPDGMLIATSTVVPILSTTTPIPLPTTLPDTQGGSQGADLPANENAAAAQLLQAPADGAQNNGPGPMAIAVTMGAILLAVGVLVAGVVRALQDNRT